MRGRARCYIIAFFALAFLGQLAVVFIYFPSSSMGSAPLLDESVFPASPAVRLATKTSNQMRSGSITTSIGTRQQVQSTPTAPLPPSMPLANPGPVQQPSFPSTDVVTAAPMQPELVSSNRGPQYDLVIGINTVTRTGSPDYLLRTLRALRTAIMASLDRRVFVLVACPVGCSTHSVYSAARLEFQHDSFFSFVSVSPSQRFMDPTPLAADPDDHNNPEDTPGKRVRQQTGDVITLLRALQTSPSPPSSYVMMMEDDFVVCDGALKEMFRYVDVANTRSQRWMGVRASYGLNGIILNMRDAPLFESWLAKKISWKPPDILYTEWVAGVEGRSLHVGGDRPYYTAQFNLFEHIGSVSSLRQTGMVSFPGCKADLSPVLWDCEKFKSNCKDLSPC